MGRAVRDSRLDKRDARLRLAARHEPYWRLISEGAHLGYYRGARFGKWVARYRKPGTVKGYVKKTIGEADDLRDADGVSILSFRQADDAARAWFQQIVLAGEAVSAGPEVTVREAVETYITARDLRESGRQGRQVKSSAAHKLRLHVLREPKLADLKMSLIRDDGLRHWRMGLPGTCASKQRITNDFKAALNMSAPNAAVQLAIKDGLASPKEEDSDRDVDSVAEIESKILADNQVRLLLRAIQESSNEDLHLICQVLAYTGARFAQVRRLKVRDVQVDRARIMMPASHKGRAGGTGRPAIALPVGVDLINTILPALEGRGAGEPLLERWRHVQIGPAEWKRDSRGPWHSASEIARPMRTAVRIAGLPLKTSTYSFRHSSIVRGLREGLPVRLVALLHDTSIQMIERNYTRFMADALEDVVRKAIMPMAEEPRGTNVIGINVAERRSN